MEMTAVGLPKRQSEILIHTASGLTRKEAARLMDCSQKNAEQLMDAVCFKLHAKNAAQAVAIAFQKGMLRVSAFVVLVSIAAGLFPAPAAQASDDDPLARRIRSRPSGRLTRRVRSSGQLADMTCLLDDFIQFHNLTPTLVWDDGLWLTYQRA